MIASPLSLNFFSSLSSRPNTGDLLQSPIYYAIVTKKDGSATAICLNPSNGRRRSSHDLLHGTTKKKNMSTSFYQLLPKFVQPSRRKSQSTTIIPTFSQKSIVFFVVQTCNTLLTCGTNRSILWITHRSHYPHPSLLWSALFARQFFRTTSVPSFYNLYKSHKILGSRWQQGQTTTHYLHGHQKSIYCLAWMGSDHVLSGGRDCEVMRWNLVTRKIEATYTAHQASVLCMRYDPIRGLITGSSDNSCWIWSPDLVPLKRLSGHSQGVLDVCFVGDLCVSASRDHSIRIWRDGETERILMHAGPVNAVASFGSTSLASASGDGKLKIWDLETGECLRTMDHDRGLACIKVNGTSIYTGGQDGKVRIWNGLTGECLSVLKGHTDVIRSIDCLGDKILTGSYDCTLRVWDSNTGQCLLSFQSGHSSWIFNVLISRSRITSAGQDKRIMILDFSDGLTIADGPSK
ncbi:WD40-repeat-containing domain protein [Phycomyces blakesleeanus]|uniref:WD40-repeat-containing domain protein n=1 Tax=Phycomyces blakesleeanus TaxID=4837 RepID=A0ABR3AKR4_PHYBL